MTMTTKQVLGLASVFLFLSPVLASAHEVHTYQINGVPYEIVIGSRNEPVIVDDKTGVDLEIIRAGKPLVGAQDALQVEMIAGDKKKIESIEPVYGVEGKYKTNFIATVPTTISYRVFGTIEETPFDVTYTCSPAGHTLTPSETTQKEIGPGIVETLAEGAFGCPQPKEAFGFPEEASSLVALGNDVREAKTPIVPEMKEEKKRKGGFGHLSSLILSASAVILSIAALLATRRPKTLSGVTVKGSGE